MYQQPYKKMSIELITMIWILLRNYLDQKFKPIVIPEIGSKGCY